MTVEWCEWCEIVNESFLPLIHNTDRYLIMYGGRGSSKSMFETDRSIYQCLTHKYFRCVLVRNTYATIKDSQYQSLVDRINQLGLSSLFEFKLQPLEINCINGNKFLARGCDDTTKLKSIKDPTKVWYEEDIPTESDFITITTSIRDAKADLLQEVFTINPEVDGDFQENWFWKKFFLGHSEKSFSSSFKETVGGKEVELKYTVHHSTYHDNRWITEGFIVFLLNLKRQDPYYYTIYCLGEWGNRITGGNFYKAFNRGLTVTKTQYNPAIPLHITFDFNVNPYMTCSIWQLSNNLAYNIGEIAALYPKNTTKGICREVIERYSKHQSGMFIYGDPSGKNAGTRDEAGHNDFTIIESELRQFKPSLRIASSHPSVTMRGKWINAIFADLRNVKVFISEESPLLIADLLNLKEAADGTKFKQKVKDEKTGVSYEKYGHFTDGMDYLFCQAFEEDYRTFQRGGDTAFKAVLGPTVRAGGY